MEEVPSQAEEDFPDVIVLNVGGQTYTTTKTTLLGDKFSMLAALFSGRYKVPRDCKGRFFIDRDGSNFSYILSFLRGERNLPPSHLALQVLADAEYFQIQGLISQLQIYPNVFKEKLLNSRNERFQTGFWKREIVKIGQELSLKNLSSTSKVLCIAEDSFQLLLEEPCCVGNQHSLLVTKHLSCGPKHRQETFDSLADRLRNPNCVIKGLGKKDMEPFVLNLQKQLTDDGYIFYFLEEHVCCKTIQKVYGYAKDSCDFALKYYYFEFTWDS